MEVVQELEVLRKHGNLGSYKSRETRWVSFLSGALHIGVFTGLSEYFGCLRGFVYEGGLELRGIEKK